MKLCDRADNDIKVDRKIKYLLKDLSPEIALEVYNIRPKTTQDVLEYLERRDKFAYLMGKKADLNTVHSDDLADITHSLAGINNKLNRIVENFAKG